MNSTELLTSYQRAVYELLIKGKSNVEIALELGLKEKTIKAHITHIFRRLDCDSRARLIARHYMGLLA